MAKKLQQQPMQQIEQRVEPKVATSGSGQQPPEGPPPTNQQWYSGDDDRYENANNDKYLNRNRGGMHHHRGYGDERYGGRSADLFDLQRESKNMGKKPLDVGETYPLGRAGDR